jgi:hypothetical protein
MQPVVHHLIASLRHSQRATLGRLGLALALAPILMGGPLLRAPRAAASDVDAPPPIVRPARYTPPAGSVADRAQLSERPVRSVFGMPDLRIASVASASDYAFHYGERIFYGFTVVVTNGGNDWAGWSTLRVRVGGCKSLETIDVRTLPLLPGQSRTINVLSNEFGPVEARADALGEVEESNESNNTWNNNCG